MKAMIPQYQTGNYELVFKDSVSVYKAVPKDEAPDPFEGSGGGNRIIIKMGGPGENGVLYKNFSNGKLLEQTSLSDKKYIITDTVKQLPWKLADETRTILNHVCRKAVLVPPTGPTVVAWYAEDIPATIGPDKFSGLPGAILQADIDSSFIVFTATEIQSSADSKEIKAPTDGKMITRADFAKEMDKIMGPADSKGMRRMTISN